MKSLQTNRDYISPLQLLHSLLLSCRYSGKEESTNMVILDITLLSGFIPDPQSLTNVSKAVTSTSRCQQNSGPDLTLAVIIRPLNVFCSQLEKALLVDRVEHKNDHVVVYLAGVRPTSSSEQHIVTDEFVTLLNLCFCLLFSL